MRSLFLLLALFPGAALAAAPPPVEMAVPVPAGAGALVRRGETGVETLCSAVLVGCRHAAVAAGCVAADAKPDALALFLPHAGRFAVEAVLTRSPNAAEPGIALVRLADPVAGVTPQRVLADEAPPPSLLVGFGGGAGESGRGGVAGIACAAVVRAEACPDEEAGAQARVCWSLLPQATPADGSDTCTADRGGLLFGEGKLVAIAPAGGEAHRPLSADAAFFRDVLVDEPGDGFCALRARADGPAAPVAAFDGALAAEQFQAELAVPVAAGTERLVVTLNGADGSDLDLYLQHASPATLAHFACADAGPGSVHVCVVESPAAGTWHVLVSRGSGRAAVRFQLTATRYGPPCADPANDGRVCDDGNACTAGDRCEEATCRGAALAAATGCDDGDPCTTGDVCRAGACVGSSSCGDGVVRSPCEECDDGNAVAGDGCEPDCRLTRTDAYVGYLVRPARAEGNRLPPNWSLLFDDLRIADGAADDPENHSVGAPQHVLMPAATGSARAPGAPRRALLRYRLLPARDGAGAADGQGRFPRTVRHAERQWQVETADGALVLDSKTVAALLVPAQLGKEPLPDAGDRGDAWLCYGVRVARGVESALAPGGRFERGMQGFFADGFRDCSRGAGAGAFAGTEVAGKCLYDLQKPVELCNPVALAPVEAPRTTSVPAGAPVATRAATAASLLCYQAQRAARVRSDAAAATLGMRPGDALAQRQPAHRKRLAADGRPLFVRPTNGLPAPTQVDTMRPELVCVPAVASVVP